MLRNLLSTMVLVCAFGLVFLGVAETAEAAGKIAFYCIPEGAVFDFDLEEAQELCTINPDGSGLTVLTSFPGIEALDYFAFSPDGSQIVVTTYFHNQEGNNPLYVMDSDGSNLLEVTFPGMWGSKVAWSPELPPTVAAISPFGQFVIVFMLGGVTALYFSRQRGQTSGLVGS